MNETVVRLHESHTASRKLKKRECEIHTIFDIITFLVPRGEKQVRPAAAAVADPATTTNITPNGRSPSVCLPSV